jgi:hypothetical protein
VAETFMACPLCGAAPCEAFEARKRREAIKDEIARLKAADFELVMMELRGSLTCPKP